MPDEAPVLEQDQPTDQAPETSDQATETTEPQTDQFHDLDLTAVPEDADREWLAKRHREMQGDYSRKTEELAELRREAEQAQQIMSALQDPEQAPALLRYLGYEVPGQEPDEIEDPDDRLSQLEKRLQEQEEQRKQAEFQELEERWLADKIGELEEKAGREFTDEEFDLLVDASTANRLESGHPNVEGAYKLLQGAYDAQKKQWMESKKAPRAPSSGTAASRNADLSNEKDRIALMAEAAEAARSSE